PRPLAVDRPEEDYEEPEDQYIQKFALHVCTGRTESGRMREFWESLSTKTVISCPGVLNVTEV
ncbi:MAG TPA: hypothetical protein VHX11_01105, partial [Acidobacteriaceae bacterium]|nr:hypothetical protein [Acidobacteriaceae bacterium]